MNSHVRIGRRRYRLPASRPLRMAIGIGLVGGGILGFLPILGFWMLPLGLLILSVDSHYVRRFRRRLELKWGRWRRGRAGPGENGEGI